MIKEDKKRCISNYKRGYSLKRDWLEKYLEFLFIFGLIVFIAFSFIVLLEITK